MSPPPPQKLDGFPFRNWAWLPLPLFFLLEVGLWAGDLRRDYELPHLLMGLNLVFSVLVSMLIALLLGRSFLDEGKPGLLLLGCGVVVWGASGFLGTLAATFLGAPPRSLSSNTLITIHNLCVFVSGVYQLAGVCIGLQWKQSLRPSKWVLVGAYAAVTGVVGVIILAAVSDWMPLFFIQGQGGTPVRQFILGSAISMFVLTAVLLWKSKRQNAFLFSYWYSLSLLLLSIGLFGVLLEPIHGGVLSWTSRAAQYLGEVYMLVAAAESVRKGDGKTITLEYALESRCYPYLVACVIVVAAAALRSALYHLLGNQFPFIEFYPAVILAALYGGMRPGLLAALLSEAYVACCLSEPVGSFIGHHRADYLAMVFFFVNCTIISWAIEAMHRANIRAILAGQEAKRVEELERAAEELRLSEARFRTLASATFEGIVITENGVILQANEQFAKMHGYEATEVIGKPAAQFLDPQDQERLRDNLLSGQNRAGEFRDVCKDGSRIIVEAHGTPLTQAGGKLRITTLRNITERKREDEERKITAELLLLVNRSGSLDELIQEVTVFFQKYSGCDSVGVRLHNGEDFPHEGSSCLGEGDQSIALFRMEQAGKLIGLLHLNSRKKNLFTLEQITLWERLAAKLAIALGKFLAEEKLKKSHDRLEIMVQERTLEMQKSYAAFRESEETLRVIANNLPNGAIYQFMRSADGRDRYNYLSEGIENLRGIAAPRAMQTPELLYTTIHPDDAARIRAAEDESARTLSPFNIEGRILTPAGEIKWLQWCSAPRRLEDGGTLWDGVVLDITARKAGEAALRRATRALLVLRECDEAMVRASNEEELLHRICQIIVEVGGAKMAWVGNAEEDENKTVRPIASWGDEWKYLRNARVSWADIPRGRGPTGTAIRTQAMSVCHDIANDPRVTPWSEQQIKHGFASSIALPLVWENQCLGALTIYSSEADAFNEEEVNLLTQLASDLTYGIVSLRTRAERSALQRELLTISEREKMLISQELHDGLCQNLAGTAMIASLLQRRLAAREDPDAEQAKQICDMLSANVNETRNLAHGLHPVGPEGEGLMNALSQLALTVSNLFHIRCAFRCPEPVFLRNEIVSTHLYRIAQEAINNARKHGEAERILITLRNAPSQGITLTIRDNGVGIPRKMPKKKGLGMKSMNHRANEIGATLTLRRAGRRGTVVTCSLVRNAETRISEGNPL